MLQPVLRELADMILECEHASPLRVGIDGIDAAGKTTLANELASILTESGRAVICASIDGFHNPRQVRYRRGPYSPEGYYYDSFNYELLQEVLLDPLGPAGNRRYRRDAFDFKRDRETRSEELTAGDTDILIFEGVFLFRPELVHEWDIKIFIDIDFQTCLDRALKRDIDLLGNRTEILRRYRERYIPGQQIYFASANPKSKADMITTLQTQVFLFAKVEISSRRLDDEQGTIRYLEQMVAAAPVWRKSTAAGCNHETPVSSA